MIVCAAMKMRDGLIVPGVRHFSPDMRQVMLRVYGRGYHLLVREQGFIDTTGKFLTREEALVVALQTGQRRFRCGGDDEQLFSENLY